MLIVPISLGEITDVDMAQPKLEENVFYHISIPLTKYFLIPIQFDPWILTSLLLHSLFLSINCIISFKYTGSLVLDH